MTFHDISAPHEWRWHPRSVAQFTSTWLFDIPARYGAYYLVARNFSGLSETGTAFSRWLLGQFAIDTEAVFRAR